MYTGTWQENTYVVTGSSGSGKSEVCKVLSQLGASVVSADDLAREALAAGSKALREVRAVFGDAVFTGNDLNRKALGALIFSDSSLREQLENITHPVIASLAESYFSKLSKSGSQMLVYDCPLFFETKLREKKFKGIVLVSSSDESKVKRLIARDGIDEALARKRLSTQLSDKDRVGFADFIIENSGSLENLRSDVEKLFALLSRTNLK